MNPIHTKSIELVMSRLSLSLKLTNMGLLVSGFSGMTVAFDKATKVWLGRIIGTGGFGTIYLG